MRIEADLSCYDLGEADLTGLPVRINGVQVGEVIEDYAGYVTIRIDDVKTRERLASKGEYSIGNRRV